MIEFVKRWEQLIGRENVQKMLRVKLKQAIRINTLKISQQELIKRLSENNINVKKIKYLKFGYFAHSRFSLSSTTEHLLGYYYIQESGSQVPAEVLDPKKSDLVLDMAAAPGSKTTQIAQMMENKGAIIALDLNPKRLNALRNNCERLGVKNVLSYKKDGRFAFELGKKFDKILLDAPCSGNFLTDEKWFEKRTVAGLKDMVQRQREMLKSAVMCSKNNGIIVYSTCSLEPEENELVIDWALKKYPELELEKINHIGEDALTEVFKNKINPEVSKCKRLWPHLTGTQPFFIAKIRVNK